MDLKSFAEVYWSMQEGKVNPGLQAYLDKKKGKKDNGDEKEEENGKESKGSKPDFLDLDKDGDKKEPMKKAAKEKKMKEESGNYVETYLDELKKTTMGSYIAKASKDLADRRFDQGDSEKRKYDPDEADEKEDKKLDKREQGIARAAKKITKEHHQKDAEGKVIEHEVRLQDQELYKAYADATPSSVEEEKTVLSKLTENGEELDMFDAVVAYLIDEGFAETLEEAQKIMSGLKPELVEEVYQNQLKKISK